MTRRAGRETGYVMSEETKAKISTGVTRRPTKKIFKDYNPETGTVWLVEWHDHFLEVADPTEYTAAIELVGTWKEWLRFKKDWPVFNDILAGWIDEVEIKLRSEAIRTVATKAVKGKDVGAAKWVAEGKYKPAKQGRLSKTERLRKQKIEEGIELETEDEVSRVLKVISSDGS